MNKANQLKILKAIQPLLHKVLKETLNNKSDSLEYKKGFEDAMRYSDLLLKNYTDGFEHMIKGIENV